MWPRGAQGALLHTTIKMAKKKRSVLCHFSEPVTLWLGSGALYPISNLWGFDIAFYTHTHTRVADPHIQKTVNTYINILYWDCQAKEVLGTSFPVTHVHHASRERQQTMIGVSASPLGPVISTIHDYHLIWQSDYPKKQIYSVVWSWQ